LWVQQTNVKYVYDVYVSYRLQVLLLPLHALGAKNSGLGTAFEVLYIYNTLKSIALENSIVQDHITNKSGELYCTR
jgi:hypothetical protein